ELLDVVDADSTWALVFVDDTAALYVERHSLASVADSFAFHRLGGGAQRLSTVLAEAASDSSLSQALRAELERASSDSHWNATAQSVLANLDMLEDRSAEARRSLRAVLAVDPQFVTAHYRLGVVALFEHSAQDAIREFENERSVSGYTLAVDLGLGMAYQ